MSRKQLVNGFKMFDAADISASVNSSTTNVQNLDGASVFVEWSGTSPVGVLAVKGRNGANGSWYEIDMGSTIDITGNTGSHQLVFLELPFTDLRLDYTRSSGTGSLTATIVAKTAGA